MPAKLRAFFLIEVRTFIQNYRFIRFDIFVYNLRQIYNVHDRERLVLFFRKDHFMKSVHQLTLSALFLALGLILPFVTGQIPNIGRMLLPMHIPVLLCGLICGWKSGLIVGFVTPILRSAIFHSPMMFPMAFAMAFELATYGAVIGLIYAKMKSKRLTSIYLSLFSAMVCGRLVYGLVMTLITTFLHQPYSFEIFMTAAITSGIPGIIVQLILIPAIMLFLYRTGMIKADEAK